MADEQLMYRPRDMYERQLKKQYHQAADEYLESLAREAGTDKGANAVHVKEYNAANAEAEAAKKKLGKAKAGKGWAIAGTIISLILGVVLIVVGAMNAATMWWLLLIGVVFLALGIVLIVLLRTRIKNAVAIAQKEYEEKLEIAKKKLEVCYADMASLNDLLDDGMPCKVMEKATPLIDLDPTFTPERLAYMMERFGMKEETDPDTSVLGVLSGHIQGNPFVLEKVFRHEVQDKVYEGELVITWTTTHTDSNGRTYTQTHTQTLHAESTHPAPAYWDETRLIYGSEAAPHLHFTRRPSGMSGKSEKEMDKFVKSRVKQLDKLEEKAVKKGETYTKLGNDEFEAFFGADDRDHEVEYRLLFTALAQRNLLELIKNPEPFGDDFIMVKDEKITSVATRHSQNFDYYVGAEYFTGYDFVAMKDNFVNYCDEFIKGVFFDLAPILSIPAYQVYKPRDFIYGGYRSNLSSFEHEVLINKMDKRLFTPKDADESLPLLLKEMNAKKIGGSDEVSVKVRSYHTTPQVDYVPVLGGDGHMHSVPVYWTQYDEVSTTRNVGLFDSKQSRPAFSHASLEPLQKYLKENFHFERGLLSYYLGEKGHISESDDTTFTKFFKTRKDA